MKRKHVLVIACGGLASVLQIYSYVVIYLEGATGNHAFNPERIYRRKLRMFSDLRENSAMIHVVVVDPHSNISSFVKSAQPPIRPIVTVATLQAMAVRVLASTHSRYS